MEVEEILVSDLLDLTSISLPSLVLVHSKGSRSSHEHRTATSSPLMPQGMRDGLQRVEVAVEVQAGHFLVIRSV